MKVAFKGLIKNLNIKSLVCGEKEARLMIDFKPSNDTLSELNKLHKPDEQIYVVIMDEKETL